MLARVAENIYWLSRYLERAESTIRLLTAHKNMLLDLPQLDDHAGWMPLISINALDEAFSKKHSRASETSVAHYLLAETENSGSLINAFSAVHYNLRSCRDIMPRASYEGINGTCRFVREQINDAVLQDNQRNAFLNSVKTRLLAISGDLNSNMSHDLGYRFMRLGCYLERADMTSRIIDVQSSRFNDGIASNENMVMHEQRWLSVLRSLSAAQMYRQHVHRPINGIDTLQYLLRDDELPRSYTFCIDHIDSTLTSFKGSEKPRQAIDALKLQLENADLTILAQQPRHLHHFIDRLQIGLQQVASLISETYFLPPETD